MVHDRNFPQWWQAPKELIELDGHCGILAAWSVLAFFGKPIAVPKLIKACRHTKRHGIFAVALGAGLKELGLEVAFHTDPDKSICGFENRCYSRARQMGLEPEPAVNLSTLLRERRCGRVPIVLFNTDSGSGHFSPLLGMRKGNLRLPLAEGGEMTTRQFLRRWSAEGILRQCIIAGPH